MRSEGGHSWKVLMQWDTRVWGGRMMASAESWEESRAERRKLEVIVVGRSRDLLGKGRPACSYTLTDCRDSGQGTVGCRRENAVSRCSVLLRGLDRGPMMKPALWGWPVPLPKAFSAGSVRLKLLGMGQRRRRAVCSLASQEDGTWTARRRVTEKPGRQGRRGRWLVKDCTVSKGGMLGKPF